REDQEVGAVVELIVFAVVIDSRDLPAKMLGCLLDHRHQVDIGVNDVDANQAVVGQVLLVDIEGFFGEQVNGRGVAGKGIEIEDVKLVSRLAFERESAVAFNDVAFAAAGFEVGQKR